MPQPFESSARLLLSLSMIASLGGCNMLAGSAETAPAVVLPDCEAMKIPKPPKFERAPAWVSRAEFQAERPDLLAKIGEVDIPRAALDEQVARKTQRYTDRNRDVPARVQARYAWMVTKTIVGDSIIRQEADARGLQPDEEELAAALARMKAGIPDWSAHLETRGETEETLRAMQSIDLLEQAIVAEVHPPNVSDEERDQAYCRLVEASDSPLEGLDDADKLERAERSAAKMQVQMHRAEVRQRLLDAYPVVLYGISPPPTPSRRGASED